MCYYESNETPDESGKVEWIKKISDQQRLPLISVTPDSCIVSSMTLQVQNLEGKTINQLQCLWSTFVSVLIHEITKAPCVEFALLTSNNSDCLEEILPIYVSIDPKSTFADIHKEIEAQLKNNSIPFYWEIQEQVDPFLSLSQPYHEVLFHIMTNKSCKGVKTTSSRPFNINLLLNCSDSELSMTTVLNPHQTISVQNCFKSVFSIFTKQDHDQLASLSDEIKDAAELSAVSGIITQNETSLVEILLEILGLVPKLLFVTSQV